MCTWLQLKVILFTPCLFQGFRMSHTYQQLRIFNILLAGTLIFSILKQDLEFSTSCLQVLKFPTSWWQDLENLQSQKLWSHKDSRLPVYKLRLLFNQVQIIDQIISSHWTLLWYKPGGMYQQHKAYDLTGSTYDKVNDTLLRRQVVCLAGSLW